jgi:oxalate decarboxylase/phosphoglucose isomerase-like protein (cupin superfamily)
METINGCTVIPSSEAPEPVEFGPAETEGVRVTAGGFVFIPRGMAHTAWNSGEGPLLGLIVISPGQAEHVFEPVEPS